MNLNIIVINAIIGVLLPWLVQLAVKWNAPASVKTLVNLFCSAVAGVLSPLLSADTIEWKIVLLSIIQVFVLSIATHYGLYKPAGVTGSAGAISNVVPIGIGPKHRTPPPSAHEDKAA